MPSSVGSPLAAQLCLYLGYGLVGLFVVTRVHVAISNEKNTRARGALSGTFTPFY